MEHSQAVTPPPQPLALRTLGGLGLYRGRDDAPLVPPGKPIALLVYLSALPGRRANREHLLNLLWADREPASARHALRQTTWYLRQRLGNDALDVGNEHLALTAQMQSDRELFLATVESGRVADAVALYRGEFLGGFAVPGGIAFEHWAESERQRLQLLFRHAAESLARDEIGHGHFRAARDLARRVRDTDPFDESGWRLLIEACLAQDDRVSALAEGQRLQQLLESEERIPEPATQALLRRANAQPEEKGRPGDATLVAELVGREREFSALLKAFEAARHRTARVVSVTAPAGLGKTRLLLDLARRLAAGGNPAVYVRAQPGDRDIPGSYMAEVARQLSSRPGASGVSLGSAGSLVALDPSISGRFAALPDPSTGDEARRRRVVAVAELIQAVSDEHPFALLLDDLHWADAYSRDALEHAIPRTQGDRVLFALAARPGGMLRAVEANEMIPLEPLTQDQIEVLLASLGSLPEDSWAGDLAAHLHTAAEGSPLLVLETLQLAVESGVLTRINGAWGCPDEQALLALLKAGSALGRRIGQLDRQPSWLLLLLSLAGTPLPTDTLAAASGQDRDRTVADLVVLESRGLVTRQGDNWSAAHDEIAARAEELATASQRIAAHAALGRVFLARSPDAGALRAAARHLGAAELQDELATLAGRWVSRARATGDRRPASLLVAELLGRGSDDAGVRRLVSALPWTVRVSPTKRMAAITAAAAATLVLLVAAFFRPHTDRPGVLIVTWSQEPTGQWRMRAHELTQQDLDRGVISMQSFKPTEVFSPNRPEGVLRPGSLTTLAATAAYPDSGGLEVALTTAGNPRVTRITDVPGDDYARAWSPDGKYLAIATDRWTVRSRSDLAILGPDQPDSAPVPVTRNPTARDEVPLWSPDGTRIAFNRASYGDPPGQVCVVSVDGHGERCLNPPGYVAGSPASWISELEIAAGLTDSAGVSRILAINAVTGAFRELAEGVSTIYSHMPGWIVCMCRRSAAEPYQALVFPAARPERAVRIEPDDPPPALTLFPARRPRSYLDRLTIEGADHPIPVDGTYRLVLKGWDAAGVPMEPLAVRWTSSDTTIATVDSGGTLHPRRRGSVMVTATAGGWRSTSVDVTIAAAQAEALTVEDWRNGFATRWVPFGEPRPFVAQSERGAALAPNGDSTFVSGVYLRRRLPTRGGLGLEFEASVPLTALQWQNLTVSFLSADSLDVSNWDLGRGNLPNLEPWRTCGVIYPATESEPGRRQLFLQGGVWRFVPIPPEMQNGRWTRLRLQFFPDGRCGVAIDGTARAILDRRVPLGDSAILLIHAYSHRTRILVGHLEAWTGVRRDVDWDAVRPD